MKDSNVLKEKSLDFGVRISKAGLSLFIEYAHCLSFFILANT